MSRLKLISAFLLLCVSLSEGGEDRFLTIPQPEKCRLRFKEAKYKDRNFFYSGHDPQLKDARLDWLDARNTCRDRCMEPLSFETQEKFDFYKKYIEANNISFTWTSGRLCDFEGCEGRWDLLPKIVKGWLWSANQVPISPTNKIPPGWSYQPWSRTGSRNRTQPDNAEFYLSQTSESCLGVLNNMYNDSVSWHDIACYHKARFICEDSEDLLGEYLNGDEKIASTSANVETIITTKPAATEVEVEATPQSEIETTNQPETVQQVDETTTTTTTEATSTSSLRSRGRNSRRRNKVARE